MVLPEPSGPKTSIDASARDAADAERDVERERAGGDGGDAGAHGVLAEPHDGALAVLLLDLLERDLQHLLAIHAVLLLPLAHPRGGSGEHAWLTGEHASGRV